jgi:hypothetical protein
VDDIPIAGPDSGQREFQEFLARYDVPAYVRRARRVEDAWHDTLRQCQTQRNKWLLMPRILLGQLHGLSEGWAALCPWLAGEAQTDVLEQLHRELAPKPRLPTAPTSSARALRAALLETLSSVERFNVRWRAYLPGVDLTRANEARENYNRYYLIEKECAMRSSRLARVGYRRLEMLTADDLLRALPLLPVPRLRD